MVTVYKSSSAYFDGFAERYDETVTRPRYDYVGVDEVFNRVSGFLEARSHATVLDVVCGTGLVGQRLKEQFPNITLLGIDVSAKMRVKAREKGVYDALKGVNLVTDKFPFANDSVDLVVSSATYDYVKSLGKSFKEISRVLQPEGRLCVTTLAVEDPEYQRINALAERLDVRQEAVREYVRSVKDVVDAFVAAGIKAQHIKQFEAFRAVANSNSATEYNLFEGQHI